MSEMKVKDQITRDLREFIAEMHKTHGTTELVCLDKMIMDYCGCELQVILLVSPLPEGFIGLLKEAGILEEVDEVVVITDEQG